MHETKKETYETPQLEQQELLRDITTDPKEYIDLCDTQKQTSDCM